VILSARNASATSVISSVNFNRPAYVALSVMWPSRSAAVYGLSGVVLKGHISTALQSLRRNCMISGGDV
jgi:hypothetical protein